MSAARRGSDLSDVEPSGVPERVGQEDAEDTVLLFVGGPLDGRVEVRAARHGDPLPTVTHVHLHDGPKVVSRYDLHPLPGQTGVYHLRPPVRQVARDEPVTD
ncbi:hypothetical protein [Geodermatophilus sp. URMC 62]|uniref:hypothetical protein n=1 Tax=Geodermatophilus sp. URMC 62 TaxID=3423414 RepID=UPI00406C0FCB